MNCNDCIYREDCKHCGAIENCDMHVSYDNSMPWHSAKMERPTKSCEVLVKYPSGFSVVSYSRRHDRFNCSDFYTDDEIANRVDFFKDVTHWAYLPEKIL